MSRAEEITSEVRKLVLTCRSLEAQLQQSIPKRTHEEVVAKMQTSIDSLTNELARTKSELENTTSLGQRISTLESKIATQSEVISSEGRTFEAISGKLVENSVPFALYTESLARVQALEAKVSSMTDSNDFNAVKQSYAELEAQIANMVPKGQYEALEVQLSNSVPAQKYEELQRSFGQMVPCEQFNVAEARVAELERALADSVPRQDFEELATKIAQITKEAAELASRAQIAVATPVVETPSSPAPTVVAPEPAPPVELVVAVSEPVATTPSPDVSSPTLAQAAADEAQTQVPNVDSTPPTVEVPQETSSSSAPAETVNALETVEPVTPTGEAVSSLVQEVAPTHAETATTASAAEVQIQPQEIAEVQSHLSEINSAIETGATTLPPVEPKPTVIVVDTEKGFRFSNTEFCAKSGMEFLEDVEKIDLSVIFAHCQSGDFERWFKDVLADETAAQSLKAIRESNASGEDLRAMLIAAIAPKYRA